MTTTPISTKSANIARKIGERLQRKRLNKNMTQAVLGQASGTSRNIVKNAENGQATLHNLIAILDALNELDSFDAFITEPDISPMDLLKLNGKKRKRAYNQDDAAEHTTKKDEAQW